MKQFTHQPFSQGEPTGLGYQREVAPCQPLETINVIFVALNKQASPLSRIVTISPLPGVEEYGKKSKRIKIK